MKLRLLEHTDILPGVRKRKGTIVTNLPPQRVIHLITQNLAEPVDYHRLPESYPARSLLVAYGYFSIEQIEAASDNTLLNIKGIGKQTLTDIRTFNKNKR